MNTMTMKNTKVIATLNRNEQKHGLEITFDVKPSDEIRQLLKDNGFRWSQKLGFWWAKETPTRLEVATQIAEQNKAKKTAKKQIKSKAEPKKQTKDIEFEVSELSEKKPFNIAMNTGSQTVKGYVFTAKLGSDTVKLGVHKDGNGDKAIWTVSELSTGYAVAHAEKRYLALEKIDSKLVAKIIKKVAEIN